MTRHQVKASIAFGPESLLQVRQNGAFDISLQGLELEDCMPGLDGIRLQPHTVFVNQVSPETLSVLYDTTEVKVRLRFQKTDLGLEVQMKLTDFSPGMSWESLTLIQDGLLKGAQKLLLHGWHSWDGSRLQPTHRLKRLPRLERISHGLTAIVGEKTYCALGFDRHDVMFHEFEFTPAEDWPRLSIRACFDQTDTSQVQEILTA